MDVTIKNKLKIISACNIHLSKVVQNIVDLCCDNDDSSYTNKAINIDKLLKQLVNNYAFNSGKNSILYDSSKKIIIPFYGKLNALSYVLNNILNNSVNYTINGTIKLSAKIISKHDTFYTIRFEIEDSITGVNTCERVALYSKNFINEQHTNNNLQLNHLLLKKKLKLLNGQLISVPTEPLNNTIAFEVSLQSMPYSNLKVSKIPMAKHNYSVLIVEDNKINQMLIKKIVEQQGYNCHTANNGLEAVNLAKHEQYDLILMDIMMPVMNGFQATKKIKKLHPYIPIIAITAIADINDKNLTGKGFSQVIEKPINKETLYKTMYNELKKTHKTSRS